MKRSQKRLSRPLYEGLPWAYVACGVAALVGSYFLSPGLLSVLLGVLGLIGLLGGTVILLRRRDYREMRANYRDPAQFTGEPDE
jgi:membrane associated rhomboid family serine protease